MNELIFEKEEKEFLKKLKMELKGLFLSGESIAIKLHMGESKNENNLKPKFVAKIVKILKSLKTEPFIFDSVALYNPRDTIDGYKKIASKNGFTESGIGCPIVISEDFITSKINGNVFEVCKPLVDADGVLILSHVKGHQCAGFGGAIKNLADALTKKSKEYIHEGGKPEYIGNCNICNVCKNECPKNAIVFDQAVNIPSFDYEKCNGCSICLYLCKIGVIKPRIDKFDKMLAMGANVALNMFKKEYFVNVLMNMAKNSDYDNEATEIVVPDIGFIMGNDVVGMDRATYDKIIERVGRDIFKEIHKKSALLHIREAERLKMGNSDYIYRVFK
ncbi:MAG: DUF362 domain-containing protein [Candidatus Aenigmarchaeota archaeon]|nr:DUF362 domain-containing protein [Candidatus Aenigmarchaeota archaeon]